MSGATRNLTKRFHELQQTLPQPTAPFVEQPSPPKSVVTYDTLTQCLHDIHTRIHRYGEWRLRVLFDTDDQVQIMEEKSTILRV